MLTMILAAAMAGQVHEVDFYFEMAQENFVIDSAKKPVRYSTFLPKELCDWVDLWDTDCARCRKQANESVVRMGPGVIRYLFYPLRAKSPSVALHAEAVINKLISCEKCGGDGYCESYLESEDSPNMCGICHSGRSWHDYADKVCYHCQGRGKFAVDFKPYERWKGASE